MTSEDLKIIMLDIRDIASIGFADVTQYPSNFTPNNVTFEITPPGFPKINVPFEASSGNVYFADDLGISDSNCAALPDGLYTVKLTMNPALNLSIEKTFLRVNAIKCNYLNIFASIDLRCNCAAEKIAQEKNKLRQAKLFIQGAVAAANKEDYLTSFKMYNKAEHILKNLIKCQCK